MNHRLKLSDTERNDRIQTLQGRVGLRLAATLGASTNALPHDITERLRSGRERALASRLRAAQARQAAPVVVAGGAGRAAALGGPPSFWWRLVAALPLLAVLVGLVLIQDHFDTQQVRLSADIDSELLADDLPPEAYLDPGFSEFLRLTAPRR